MPTWTFNWNPVRWGILIHIYQVLPSDLFGCFKWPFQGLSDLHLGDQKVTWKKLVHDMFLLFRLQYHSDLLTQRKICTQTTLPTHGDESNPISKHTKKTQQKRNNQDKWSIIFSYQKSVTFVSIGLVFLQVHSLKLTSQKEIQLPTIDSQGLR